MAGTREKIVRDSEILRSSKITLVNFLSVPPLLTGQTLTGDEFIGKLYRANKALIPQAMDRWGTPC